MSTQPAMDLDALRERGILASRAGFPFLAVFAAVWTAAGALSYAVPAHVAPWIYALLGVPAMPLAIALERRIGYVRPAAHDPLLPLTLQILFVQVAAYPAVLLVWDLEESYMPVALAAVVGAHFLPFEWVYRTRIYRFLGLAVAVGPLLLAIPAGERALHLTGFYVGAALLAGALAVRAHARNVRRASRAA